MILIVNQHKGSWTELTDHLDQLKKIISDSKNIYVSMVIDQSDKDIDRDKFLSRYASVKDRMIIHFNRANYGLGFSRSIALELAKQRWDRLLNLDPSNNWVIFGCTNSKWIISPDQIEFDEIDKEIDVCLLRCHYDDWMYERKSFNKSIINFNDYLNNELKEDYTLSFRFSSLSSLKYYPGEVVFPEDVYVYESCRGGQIYIKSDPVMNAWYNSKGLSKSFNRRSQTNNKKGYSYRAKLFLDGFLEGTLPLTHSRVKGLVYDLVTLTEELYVQEYLGTLIEPLIFYSLQRWTTNPQYRHRIKFIETEI